MGNRLGKEMERKLCQSCFEVYKTRSEEICLRLAAKRGHVQCLGALVKAGAAAANKHVYQLALNNAAEHGSLECMNILINAGASVNYTQNCRLTMVEAAECGQKAV